MNSLVEKIVERGCVVSLHGEKLLFNAPDDLVDKAVQFVKENKKQIIQELKNGEQQRVIPSWCQGWDCVHCFAGQVIDWNERLGRVVPVIRLECFRGNNYSPLGMMRRCPLTPEFGK